jgi:hypothetical protein
MTHHAHETAPERAPRIVISMGDLPGLLAAAIASEETVRRDGLESGRPLVWCPSARGLEAVRRQARALGLGVLEFPELFDEQDGATVFAGQRASRLLMEATATALAQACPVVVWPVVPRGRVSDEPAPIAVIADAVNRATLVGRLASLDAPNAGIPEVRIETPFVDLSDTQVADLACDLGVRFEDCWWWRNDTSAASDERARWAPLLPLPS